MKLDLMIYSTHIYSYDGTQYTTLHRHIDEYELFYSCDEIAWYEFGGKSTALSSGNVALVRPDIGHKMISSPKGRVLDIKFSILSNELCMMVDTLQSVTCDLTREQTLLLAQIMNISTEKGVYYQKITALLLEAFLYILLSPAEKDNKDEESFPDAISELNIDYEHLTPCVQRALPFIDGFAVLPVEPFRVSTLAKQCGYDSRYLGQKFKDDIGISITQYFGLIRIKKAKEFLCDTELSILEISGLLCYTNPAHFMKNFKKNVGISPSKYRKLTKLS